MLQFAVETRKRFLKSAQGVLCGEKMTDDRKGSTQWETKAARRIRTSIGNRRKAKGNKTKKIRRISSRKESSNGKQGSIA
jgi:hypothetical protein